MQKQSKRLIWMVVIIALLIVVGLIRDKLFIRLNYQIEGINEGNSPYPYSGIFWFINNPSAPTLLKYKWIFTAVFYILHWAISLLLVYTLFRDKWNFKLVHVVYASVLSIAATGYVLFLWNENGYTFARSLLGAGQSPMLVMLIGIVCYLRTR